MRSRAAKRPRNHSQNSDYSKGIKPPGSFFRNLLGVLSSDLDGTYRLFVSLGLSGKFNSTFRNLGIAIPDHILDSPTYFRVQ
jgi:hypothetical protein